MRSTSHEDDKIDKFAKAKTENEWKYKMIVGLIEHRRKLG